MLTVSQDCIERAKQTGWTVVKKSFTGNDSYTDDCYVLMTPDGIPYRYGYGDEGYGYDWGGEDERSEWDYLITEKICDEQGGAE